MITLLTGGSACGKSTYAEKLAAALPGPRYYIAAMRPYDAESEAKIARHRAQRADKGFVTFERYTELAGLTLPARGTALLECVCNLVANEMFDGEGRERDPVPAVLSGIESLARQSETLIVVTNDVGADGGGYAESTMRYVTAVGRINAALAARAARVLELVCGIPIVIKGDAG